MDPMEDTDTSSILMHIEAVSDDGEGSVQLLDYMGTDEAIAVTSYRKRPDNLTPERIYETIFNLIRHGHNNSFDLTAHLRFRIRAPRLVYESMLPYRSATIVLVQEPRQELAFLIPTSTEWQRRGGEGDFHPELGILLTNKLGDFTALSIKMYLMALKSGLNNEQAAYFLAANVSYTTFEVRMSLYDLLQWIDGILSADQVDQPELKKYARVIHQTFIAQTFPLSYRAFSELRLKDR